MLKDNSKEVKDINIADNLFHCMYAYICQSNFGRKQLIEDSVNRFRIGIKIWFAGWLTSWCCRVNVNISSASNITSACL